MRAFLFAIFCFVSVACTEIVFKEPQPKGVKKLKSFPASLQGSYLVPEGGADSDTLEITKHAYSISGNTTNKDEWLNKGSLGDSLVLKKYKEFFFLNFYVEGNWVIRPFRQEKNGNIILFEINLMNDTTVQMVKDQFHPEIIKNDSDTFYKIDPTRQELLDFIKTKYTPQQPLTKIRN